MTKTPPPAVIFIGSPTTDVLVGPTGAHQITGGAGFISALAARWAGAETGLVARVPATLPAPTSRVFGSGGLHRGGLSCFDGTLPSFRISYDTEAHAHYTSISPGLESDLCAADIPRHWLTTHTQWIHIAGIGFSSSQQLQMLKDIKSAVPAWMGTLSAGTAYPMIRANKADSLALLAAADVFFLNGSEFDLLCPEGLPEDCATTVIITRGAAGVEVIGGPHTGTHSAIPVKVVDPTGAGDAFCGGFIGASIVCHPDPVHRGLQAAAKVLGGLGATSLCHWVAAHVDTRADDSADALRHMSPAIKAHAQSAAFDFTAPPHLPTGHPLALEMLCISTLHQFGFWTATSSGGWTRPMLAAIDGQVYKGSDFIWAAFARAGREDPSLLSLKRMATQPGLFARICTDDDGGCPVPQLERHNQLHATHANAMLQQWGGDYTALLDHANATLRPIATLLESLGRIPGYMADPLAKKANLLAIILTARPEGFVQAKDPDSIAPIVDYHMMRLCLRMGLVVIIDPDLRRRIEQRLWVDTAEELAIRQATGRAINALAAKTGVGIAAIDGLFFSLGRTVCVETEAPRCDDCPLSANCAKDTRLFQPVFRTTAY